MTEPKKPQPGDTVAISCRGHSDCPGRQAVFLSTSLIPGPVAGLSGGTTLRYRCLTCNRKFQITY